MVKYEGNKLHILNNALHLVVPYTEFNNVSDVLDYYKNSCISDACHDKAMEIMENSHIYLYYFNIGFVNFIKIIDNGAIHEYNMRYALFLAESSSLTGIATEQKKLLLDYSMKEHIGNDNWYKFLLHLQNRELAEYDIVKKLY